MKLVRDIKEIEGRRPDVLIITGNGKTERRRILPPLCKKYNGKAKFLWFPEPPKGKKETGLKPLNAIRDHLIKYKLERFLFLIDREHFKGIKQGEEQKALSEYLGKELKVRIETTSELLSEKAFISRGYLGAYPFDVCIVIFGVTSNIEEEISELIRLKFKVRVKPDKAEIRRFLKGRGKEFESLIGVTPKKHLEEAFPGLCNALKRIDES